MFALAIPIGATMGLLLLLIISQCPRSSASGLKAAVNTKYKLRVHQLESDSKPPPLQQIEIEANHLPLSIHFKSRSSKLALSQSHSPRQPEIHRSSSEEAPDILLHDVKKPVLHQLREIIIPLRKTIQHIEPVREEMKRIVSSSREHHDDSEPADHGQHRSPGESSAPGSYYSSSRLTASDHRGAAATTDKETLMMAKSGEAKDEPDTEMQYSGMREDPYSNEEDHLNSLQAGDESMSIESDLDLTNNDADIEDDDGTSISGFKVRRGSTGRGDHLLPQPSFQRRRATRRTLRPYPVVSELQRLATRYMMAQHAKQLKEYLQEKTQHKVDASGAGGDGKPVYLQHHKNQLDDMIFGDSKNAPKYTRKRQIRPGVKRNSVDFIYGGVYPSSYSLYSALPVTKRTRKRKKASVKSSKFSKQYGGNQSGRRSRKGRENASSRMQHSSSLMHRNGSAKRGALSWTGRRGNAKKWTSPGNGKSSRQMKRSP